MTFRNHRAPAGHRICRHLRAKEMFYTVTYGAGDPRGHDEGLVTDPELDRHDYWCARTCRARGPKGDVAALEECAPDRDCYES